MERRHKSAELVAAFVLPTVEFIRNETTILSNVPRLPEIMREQLKQPIQKGAFAAVLVLGAACLGVMTWAFFDNPVPGMVFGAYRWSVREIIANSIFE